MTRIRAAFVQAQPQIETRIVKDKEDILKRKVEVASMGGYQ